MFGKKNDPSDYRVHERHSSAANMRVIIDGVECRLHDYSDGGVRISSRGPTRRVALIEIHRNGKCIRKSPAIIAWRRENEAGYAFRSKLKICEVDGAQQYKPAEQPKSMNATGAVSGDALRRRLKI